MTDNEKEVFYLDFYETEQGTRWNWKKGPFASEEFESERAALGALSDGRVKFSTLDDEDLLGALDTSAEFNDDLLPPFDYWLIDGITVLEPNISGRLLGKLPEFRIAPGMKALKMSTWDFQALREDGDDDESNDTEKIDQDTDQKANVATVKNHETLVEKVQAYSQRAEKLGVSANELQAAGSVVGQFGIDDQLVQLILDDEKGPLITIYLSQNLAELEKLIQMPIIAATTHIATVIKAKAGLVPLK